MTAILTHDVHSQARGDGTANAPLPPDGAHSAVSAPPTQTEAPHGFKGLKLTGNKVGDSLCIGDDILIEIEGVEVNGVERSRARVSLRINAPRELPIWRNQSVHSEPAPFVAPVIVFKPSGEDQIAHSAVPSWVRFRCWDCGGSFSAGQACATCGAISPAVAVDAAADEAPIDLLPVEPPPVASTGKRKKLSHVEAQRQTLDGIKANPGISQADLGVLLGVTRPTINERVRGLAERGFIHIQPLGKSRSALWHRDHWAGGAK